MVSSESKKKNPLSDPKPRYPKPKKRETTARALDDGAAHKRRTNGIVLQKAQRPARPRAHHGLVVARQRHGDDAHGNGSGFRCEPSPGEGKVYVSCFLRLQWLCVARIGGVEGERACRGRGEVIEWRGGWNGYVRLFAMGGDGGLVVVVGFWIVKLTLR